MQARGTRPGESAAAPELDQHQYRERSEGREDRRLRLPDHLVREREHRRNDDRGARGALQRCDVRHGGRVPVQDLDALGRRRTTQLINQHGAMF